MVRSAIVLLITLVACSGPDSQPRGPTPQVPVSSAPAVDASSDARPFEVCPSYDGGFDGSFQTAADASIDAAVAEAPAVTEPERWLRGSTHVHAKPSGDSVTAIPDVITWYESRGYDFIVLTDHNRVSELDDA